MTPNQRSTGRKFWNRGFLVNNYPPIIHIFNVCNVKIFWTEHATVRSLTICAEDGQWDTWAGIGNADDVTTVCLLSSRCVYPEFPSVWSRSITRFLHSIILMRHVRPFWPVKVTRSHVAVRARQVYGKRPKGMPVIYTDVTKIKARMLKSSMSS